MSRPTNKNELIEGNSAAFEALNNLLESLTEAGLEKPFPFLHRDRNVRDVLGHLLEWQRLLFGWYKTGMRGGDPEMPCKGFRWKDTAKLNHVIWEGCQSMTLKDVRAKLRTSHNQLQKLVQQHTNKDLFAKGRYHWTGTTSLAVYFRAAGWSHYQWALKLLRKFARQTHGRS